MTAYRLPEALGGGEVEAVDPPVVVEGTPVRTAGGDVLLVPMSLLTEVKPPLPPEPDFGELVATGTDGNLLPIYRRWMDIGWAQVGSVVSYNAGDAAPRTWGEICADAQARAGRWPVRLVPVEVRS